MAKLPLSWHRGKYLNIFKLSESVILKSGDRDDRLAEVMTMRCIRSHTSVPVPDVLDADPDPTQPRCGFLVMSFVVGDVLQDA